MPKFTIPKALWNTIEGLQSVGGTQFEGNSYVSEHLRYVKPDQGIDVEYKNKSVNANTIYFIIFILFSYSPFNCTYICNI